MKLVIAYVRSEMLQNIKHKLYAREIYSMSITNVMGAGRQKGYTETYRGVQTEVNLLKKLRIDVGVQESQLEAALEAIKEGAHTGKEGDGVIFVIDLFNSIRIRTGENMS
ncbi:MAG: transcriptional regulator [Candidatus Adiutrix intracellularis]|jgi:nitrogen regulatory protein P-II 1|nr:MAG: transcriptional regulator [Candidatus Adiutrix intracellularis]MDR2827626.1 P-II family nitrogen regulator [Candidatus Adiutrix intracellularis]